MYPLQVRIAGAIPIQVPLRDETFDLYAMLAAVTDRTRLIFVCNPNNPTSTVVDPRGADPLCRGGALAHPHCHRRGLCRVHSRRHAARQPGSRPVPMQCRCAADIFEGLRAGRSAGRLRDRRPSGDQHAGQGFVPFTTTSISQAAATASLEAADELLARTDAVVAERARVPPRYAAPGSRCRRRRPTSSGCRWGYAHRISLSRPPTRASFSARTAPTVCGSRSAHRKKTTHCCGSRRTGARRRCGPPTGLRWGRTHSGGNLRNERVYARPAGSRPVKATSWSNAGESSGTSTGSANPAVERPRGIMIFFASPKTYSATESATFTSRPVAVA